MFSASSAYSMVVQLARLVVPFQRRDRDKVGPSNPAPDGCGCCPECGEFVFVEFSASDLVPCPRCGVEIDGVEPLGGPSLDQW